jgi:hypothetical protein
VEQELESEANEEWVSQKCSKKYPTYEHVKTFLPTEDQGRKHEVTAIVSHKGLNPAK